MTGLSPARIVPCPAHKQNPAGLDPAGFVSEVPSGFEPENKGFADLKFERSRFIFYTRSDKGKRKEASRGRYPAQLLFLADAGN